MFGSVLVPLFADRPCLAQNALELVYLQDKVDDVARLAFSAWIISKLLLSYSYSGLPDSIEYDAASQKFRQDTRSAISVAREYGIGRYSASTDLTQRTRDLWVVASPISAKQDILPAKQFLLDALIL